jgi:amidohydrolase
MRQPGCLALPRACQHDARRTAKEPAAMSRTRANDPTTAIRDATQRIEAGLIEVRRDIHAHPELGFEEVRTAGIVSRELTRLGITHQTAIGRTGVVGVIKGGRPGPVLAIRADMDALPIEEKSGLPFASTHPGLMHACGHDIHTTTLLGVAAVLQELAPQIAGTVKLVFQPAEEGLGGMQAMIDDGVMDGPKVDLALGFHNHPDMPVGTFGFVHGACLAASDRFDIVVRGKSGHAAYPHTTVDPLVAAAMLVAQLQTIVSREVPPMMPAVVTVGAINGGTTYNIIPDSCVIKGTVRTLHREARDIAEAAIKRLATGMLDGMRVTGEVDYRRGVPPLRNDDRVLEPAVAAVRRQFGDAISEFGPSLGGEDFALMAERVPAFQLRVGSSQPGRADKLHNSAYQPDERCIGFGVQALSRAALELLA